VLHALGFGDEHALLSCDPLLPQFVFPQESSDLVPGGGGGGGGIFVSGLGLVKGCTQRWPTLCCSSKEESLVNY